MKVILTERVYKHGVAGDVVDVSDGFARNYLLPQGLAIKATPGALRQNQHLIEQAEQHREELQHLLDEVSAQIHGVELLFGVKAGKNNKLYGSVTTRDIAQALEEKTGVDIDRRRISERPLRELGVHEVPVRMSADVSPVLRVVVVREEEVDDYLAGKPVESLDQEAEDEGEGEGEEDAAEEGEAAAEASAEAAEETADTAEAEEEAAAGEGEPADD
jgi:large subunit ribosomal protein L9